MNGDYGAGLLAFQQLGEALAAYAGPLVLIGAVGFISWCRS